MSREIWLIVHSLLCAVRTSLADFGFGGFTIIRGFAKEKNCCVLKISLKYYIHNFTFHSHTTTPIRAGYQCGDGGRSLGGLEEDRGRKGERKQTCGTLYTLTWTSVTWAHGPDHFLEV